MKCSNHDCNRGIGLVAYRRGWSGKGRYCSKQCRDEFVAERVKQPQQGRSVASYFDWLLLQPIENPQPKLIDARDPVLRHFRSRPMGWR